MQTWGVPDPARPVMRSLGCSVLDTSHSIKARVRCANIQSLPVSVCCFAYDALYPARRIPVGYSPRTQGEKRPTDGPRTRAGGRPASTTDRRRGLRGESVGHERARGVGGGNTAVSSAWRAGLRPSHGHRGSQFKNQTGPVNLFWPVPGGRNQGGGHPPSGSASTRIPSIAVSPRNSTVPPWARTATDRPSFVTPVHE